MCNTNTTYKFKSIKPDKKRPILLIELLAEKDKKILQGSRIYCGVCGEQLGTVRTEMQFPFTYNDFLNNLDNKTCMLTPFDLHHSTCSHVICPGYGAWAFVGLAEYFTATARERATENLLANALKSEEQA